MDSVDRIYCKPRGNMAYGYQNLCTVCEETVCAG